MSYKGIKIPDKVWIVQNSHNQGYVVPAGDKSALESAYEWAGLGGWRFQDDEQKRLKREENTFEIENGKFILEIIDSADNSSQGGKLSFWTCKITYPVSDGHDYKSWLIGINAENLCDLIHNSEMFYGTTKGVWLGKKNGRTCAFRSIMDDFKQAQKDEEARTKSKSGNTSKYQVGDIVETLTTKMVYMGEYTPKFDLSRHSSAAYAITIYEQPHTRYYFRTYNESYNYAPDYLYTKPPRKVTGHIVVESPLQYWQSQLSRKRANPECLGYYSETELELLNLHFQSERMSSDELRDALKKISTKYPNVSFRIHVEQSPQSS